jgi:MoxR-like ATPase
MQVARQLKLSKVPGVAETLDWAVSLMALHQDHLDPDIVSETLGCLFKDREDIVRYAGPRMEAIVRAVNALGPDELDQVREHVLVDGSGVAAR